VGRVARVAFAVTAVALLALLWRSTWVRLGLAADNPGTAFPSSRVGDEPLRIAVSGGGAAGATLSGVAIEDVSRDGDVVLVRLPAGLPEGGYDLQVVVDRPFPFGSSRARWPVVVDNQPPGLSLAAAPGPGRLDRPVMLSGSIETGASLEVDDPSGTPVTVTTDPAGTFTVTFERAPGAPVGLVATDRAGNVRTVTATIPVVYPSPTRAAHLPIGGWADDRVRLPFLQLVEAGLIDTVQLDLKDETGTVGFDSQVPLARTIGAVRPAYDLAAVVAGLEERGVRVIGRIVAFRDPVLAEWAWDNGRQGWVLQDRKGEMLSAFGGYTNYAEQSVRDYNLALAREAVALGVHDILWDYVRRPEGDPGSMVVPGMTGTSRTTGDNVVEFLGQAREQLRPMGAYVGATVMGIAARRPENIGQPVDRIATVVDYVAPTLYPANVADGDCGAATPKRQPYAVVSCTAREFAAVLRGTPAVLVPWLQDFSLDGVTFGPDEVRDQVRAATDAGAAGFLLWNPAGAYRFAG